MEEYIQISKINDFVFCPRSLYFHSLYENFNKDEYQEVAQKEGTLRHETVDKGTYSSRKDIITSLPVYSDRYMIAGKIDIFDKKKGHLIERKTKIKKVYDGYRYQLYAQYFAMEEMGYKVEKLFLHSIKDNKRYEIEKPEGREKERFELVIRKIKGYDLLRDNTRPNEMKCSNCIYRNLCDMYVVIA